MLIVIANIKRPRNNITFEARPRRYLHWQVTTVWRNGDGGSHAKRFPVLLFSCNSKTAYDLCTVREAEDNMNVGCGIRTKINRDKMVMLYTNLRDELYAEFKLHVTTIPNDNTNLAEYTFMIYTQDVTQES